jgi:deoxyribonuclease-4
MTRTRTTSTGDLPLIGAQVSTAGGFAPVPQRAVDIGAEVVQIFNTNPRIWKPRVPIAGEIAVLTAGLREHHLRLFFHGSYLINLASADDALRNRSSEALASALVTGALAGAEAIVTHVGSHRGEATATADLRVIHSISEAVASSERVLAASKADRAGGNSLPALLLETGAGGGNTVGGRLEDLAALLSLQEAAGLVRDLRLGICIDTAHLFAAGYPLHEPQGLEELVARLRSLGLLDRIHLVHLNDSKTPFGVRRDQHENLGKGSIGYEGLARVVRHPAFVHLPFILEVPGFDGHGPDAANIDLAKSMRRGSPRDHPPGAGPGVSVPR